MIKLILLILVLVLSTLHDVLLDSGQSPDLDEERLNVGVGLLEFSGQEQVAGLHNTDEDEVSPGQLEHITYINSRM